jgi:hypothetical protein
VIVGDGAIITVLRIDFHFRGNYLAMLKILKAKKISDYMSFGVFSLRIYSFLQPLCFFNKKSIYFYICEKNIVFFNNFTD